jgi:hypothetical protein
MTFVNHSLASGPKVNGAWRACQVLAGVPLPHILCDENLGLIDMLLIHRERVGIESGFIGPGSIKQT